MTELELSFASLTPELWDDLEALFGPRGACGGCWCMFWRQPRAEFEQLKGETNRKIFQAITLSGELPGILAYHDNKPIGWICIGPRERFPTLERSRLLKKVDDQPVWSVVCFYVAKKYRQQGVGVQLLHAAVNFARQQGATIVEGYPQDTGGNLEPAPFVYTGLVPLFTQAGFREVLRRSNRRPIMRLEVE